MSLQIRKEVFSHLVNRFRGDFHAPLVASVQANTLLFKKLQLAAAQMLSASLPEPRLLLQEDELLREIERQRSHIKNITPNGLIVPKRHMILEYNLLVRTFHELIASLGILDLVESWSNPNLRIKDAQMVQENIGRPHSTEKPHSDAWAGELPNSLHVITAIFGDAPRNFVHYFSPPPEFEESWLSPLPNFDAGAEYVARYTPVDMPQEVGRMYFADFATLHATTREPNCGPRISMDVIFAIKPGLYREKIPVEKAATLRVNERITPEEFASIGKERLFVFPDFIDQPIVSSGAYKNAANKKLIQIVN